MRTGNGGTSEGRGTQGLCLCKQLTFRRVLLALYYGRAFWEDCQV